MLYGRAQRRLGRGPRPIDLGVPRLPILVRVATFANAQKKNANLQLFDFLGPGAREQGAPLAEAHLQAMFNDFVSREQAVILLDGLDEVSNWRERQEVVRAIELFMTTHVGDTNTQQSALLASSQGSGESDEEQSREGG